MEYKNESENQDELILREPAVVYGKNKFSEEEYLDIERTAIARHEFYQGEIFHMYGHGELLAMSGAAHDHNEIFTNLFGELCARLKGSSCKPYGPDKRLHIPQNTLYTYPDISVYCNTPSTKHGAVYSENPTVIIEILSPSTRQYDMGAKFELYKAIPALKEYILADAKEMAVYVHRINTSGDWETTIYRGEEEAVTIKSLGVAIFLHEIYEGTKLFSNAI